MVACGAEVEEALQPDQLLRDSLGLTEDDRVYRVSIDAVDNQERVQPGETRVLPDSWVQFMTADGRVHTVAFELDSLAPAAAAFLRDRGQERSPPLVERETRFLVNFQDAPAGRYPFVVEGNGAATRGAVVVAEDEG